MVGAGAGEYTDEVVAVESQGWVDVVEDTDGELSEVVLVESAGGRFRHDSRSRRTEVVVVCATASRHRAAASTPARTRLGVVFIAHPLFGIP